jgi:hypothetical protein
MDEICVITALRPGIPDDEEHTRARARARLMSAFAEAAGSSSAPAARPRHRRWVFAAIGTAAATAVAAGAIGFVLAGGSTGPTDSAPRSSASGQSGSLRIVTDAWTLQRTGTHGTVSLTLRAAMTGDLAGLQSALVKAGVPAIVRASAPVSACIYRLDASALEPLSVQHAVIKFQTVPAGVYHGQRILTGLYTLDPSAMPKGSVVFIADRNGPGSYGIPHPEVLTAGAIPACVR